MVQFSGSTSKSLVTDLGLAVIVLRLDPTRDGFQLTAVSPTVDPIR